MYMTADLGQARLVASKLPSGSHLVRVHPKVGADYDRLIVVTEQENGRALFLSGWIGAPLLPREWREAAATLFPHAKVVRFERRTRGQVRLMEVQL